MKTVFNLTAAIQARTKQYRPDVGASIATQNDGTAHRKVPGKRWAPCSAASALDHIRNVDFNDERSLRGRSRKEAYRVVRPFDCAL